VVAIIVMAIAKVMAELQVDTAATATGPRHRSMTLAYRPQSWHVPVVPHLAASRLRPEIIP